MLLRKAAFFMPRQRGTLKSTRVSLRVVRKHISLRLRLVNRLDISRQFVGLTFCSHAPPSCRCTVCWVRESETFWKLSSLIDRLLLTDFMFCLWSAKQQWFKPSQCPFPAILSHACGPEEPYRKPGLLLPARKLIAGPGGAESTKGEMKSRKDGAGGTWWSSGLLGN